MIVSEPAFSFSGFSIADQSNNVETKPTITATYSLALTRSDNFGKIALTDEQGKKVEGSASISDKTISFTPTQHLQPLSTYTLTIPKGAVKNKWGTDYQSDQKVTFATKDWRRMTLSVQPETRHLTPGDEITLTCSAPEATIYYSTDDHEPTTRYEGPIRFEGDMTLRAVARLDGYYDADLPPKEYLRSVEIASKYPSEPLYNYADVNPSITFSYPIERGAAFSGIMMQDVDGEDVDCQLLIQGATLFIVPEAPLQDGMLYTVSLPAGALLVTDRDEENQAHEWTFVAGNYATAVSVGGPELMVALKTDGSLWTWGRWLTSANSEDGSYSTAALTAPASFVDADVVAVSSGFMHHALLKRDGSLWMWGRQLCGEFGNGSREASAQPVRVMDGVRQVSCGLQTTAIVKADGTLWMCGRNDLGQIDTTHTVYTSFIYIEGGVSDVRLNWGSMDIVKTDGTTVTRTWDATADDGRSPVGVGITNAAQTAYGWQNAVALGEDGSVWAWSEDAQPQEVISGRNPQPLEGVALLSTTLTLQQGERAVIAHRPQPLLADYSTLTWQSDNEQVATVSNRGVVRALADGKAVVTAVIADGLGREYQAQCQILVGDQSGISERSLADGWQLRVSAGRGQLSVSGVPEGQAVSVYSASGACVWQGVMSGQQMTVATHQRGVYVVRAGQQVRKVVSK